MNRELRRLPLATLIGAALLVGACASAPIEPEPPLESLPEAWTAATADLPVESRSDWWTEFDDPELERIVSDVLASNNDLAAAVARVDAAAARARIAGADLAPNVGIDGSGLRSRRNFIGFPIPGSEGGVASSTSTSLGVNLNVSWEIDVWGRLRAAKAAATANLEAAEADLAGARLSLAGQAAKVWFGVAEARLQVGLAEETLASRTLTRERLRRRYELGTRDALDLRLAISNEEAARASLASRRRTLDAVERQLQLLLARYPATGGAADLAQELPEAPGGTPALLPAELISRRPDLAAQEQRLAAAGFDVRRARASLYPAISLTGSTGRLSSEVEDLLDSDFSVWSLAANLLQPVFQGGRLRAGVDLAEARQRELASTWAQAVLEAFADVELALAAAESLAVQADALRLAAEQAVEAQKLAERRYDAGLADFLSVLQSQRDASLSQTALLAVRRQQLEARVDLHLALGGGFGAAPPPSS